MCKQDTFRTFSANNDAIMCPMILRKETFAFVCDADSCRRLEIWANANANVKLHVAFVEDLPKVCA